MCFVSYKLLNFVSGTHVLVLCSLNRQKDIMTSGCAKRKRKKAEELFNKSQKGALDRFIVKVDVNVSQSAENVNDIDGDHGSSQLSEHDNVSNDGPSPLNNNAGPSRLSENDIVLNGYLIDIYDPRYWENLETKMRDTLVERGPKRELNLVFPLNKKNMHFSYEYYSRKSSNEETCDRNWLFYSTHVNKVYCFCCKLFKTRGCLSVLANDGYNDWKHLSECLNKHERSVEHMSNMRTWNEMKIKIWEKPNY